MRLASQLLLIDADDTLWENNVYFERAIAAYMELLAPSGLQRAAIRERINQEERETIADMGYGLKSFCEALTRAYGALVPGAPDASDHGARARIAALAASIAGEPIEFLPEAEATLRYLAGRHRLALVTKGDFAEQTRKVALSGLAPLFEEMFRVVPEKDETVYREALRQLGGEAASSWMIGNSPRSDINPALAAGLNAVFIPHPQTWVLEHDEIVQRPGRRLLEIERLADLREYF